MMGYLSCYIKLNGVQIIQQVFEHFVLMMMDDVDSPAIWMLILIY